MASSRILVAVSSPWASEKLVAVMRDLALRLSAHVIVAHVAKPTDQDDSNQDVRTRGEQTLNAMTRKLTDAGVSAEGVMLFGDDVGQAILNAAASQSVSLIVLGMSGKGRLLRILAGDIPNKIMRNANLPVLTLPPDWSGTL